MAKKPSKRSSRKQVIGNTGGNAPSAVPQAPSHGKSSATASSSRTIRIFISSTFRDFAQERDLLVRKVFPELRRLCRERQVELIDVDLRWGITEDEAKQGRVLPICLAEIDRARPFFIGLLGERYGWVPSREQFDRSLLIEQPWLEEHADGRSVTELEVLHGVLNNPRMAGRAFFYFRDPNWSVKHGPDYVSEGHAEKQKLADLKQRIRDCDFPVLENYPTPEALTEKVRDELRKFIDEEYPKSDVPDPLTVERRRHEAYGSTRRRLYLGGERYFEAMDGELAAEAPRPVLIRGQSGGGKSSLLANWLAHWVPDHPEATVFVHHLGCGADAADPLRLAIRLMREIAVLTGDEFKPKSDPDEELKELPQWLAIANAWAERTDRTLLLVFDGLDKLADRRHLRWFPAALPSRVKLVASCLDDDVLEAARHRLDWRELVVEPFTPAEQAGFICEYLGRYRKHLTPKQADALQAHPLSGNPLFLLTVLEELRVFGVHEDLDRHLRALLSPPPSKAPGEEPTVDDVFEHVLARIEGDVGREPVQRVMETIWASRAGLYTDELLAIADIPPATWAAIENALDESLYENGGRISFGHDYLRKAVEDRYAIKGEARFAIHDRIAAFFTAQPSFYDLSRSGAANTRKTFELTWQLVNSHDWSALDGVITDIEFLMASVHGGNLSEVLADLNTAVSALGCKRGDAATAWLAFVTSSAHKLSRGHALWPASRIMLQLALDQAPTTSWCQAAEAWYESGRCSWPVLRAVTPTSQSTEPIIHVPLDGTPVTISMVSTGSPCVAGLSDGRLLHIDPHTLSVIPFAGRTACRDPVRCVIDEARRNVLATLAPDEVAIWDLDTHAFIARLGVHTAPIDQLALLDADVLVSFSHPYGAPASLSAWDLQSRDKKWAIDLPCTTGKMSPFCPCCGVIHDGISLIAICDAGRLTLIESGTGRIATTVALSHDEESIPSGLLPAEGGGVVCVFSDGGIGAIDLTAGYCQTTSAEPMMTEWHSVMGAALLRANVLIASSSGGATLLTQDTGSVISQRQIGSDVKCMAVSKDTIAFGCSDELIIVDAQLLSVEPSRQAAHQASPAAWSQTVDHAYAGASGRLITIGAEEAIVWHHHKQLVRCPLAPPGMEQPGTFEGPPMVAHALSDNGRRLVTICNWGHAVELRVWDAETGTLVTAALPFNALDEDGFMQACVMSVCFMPSREDLVVCGHIGGKVSIVQLSNPPRVSQVFRVDQHKKVYEVAPVDDSSVLIKLSDAWEVWTLWPEPQQKSRHPPRPVPECRKCPVPRVELAHAITGEASAVMLRDPVMGDTWWHGERGLTCVAINDCDEIVVGDSFGEVLHLQLMPSRTNLNTSNSLP